MGVVRIPSALQELLGDRQDVVSLVAIGMGGVLAPVLVGLAQPGVYADVALWRSALAVLLLLDIGAGIVSNLTPATGEHYAGSARLRWIFLAVHLHLPAIGLLLGLPLVATLVCWAAVIASGCLVNALRAHPAQRAVAGVLLLVCLALPVILAPDSPALIVAAGLFAVKIVYAFAVDHAARSHA